MNEPLPPPLPAAQQYREFRADGFPLCPACGEDELHNISLTLECVAWNATVSPREYIKRGLSCYVCGWKSAEVGG